jgi:hypothetical protein
MPTTAYEWRGGWIVSFTGTLQPGAVDPYAHIYGLTSTDQPVELAINTSDAVTIAQIIQQWESLGHNGVLCPLAYTDAELIDACARRGIAYPTVFSAITPLPAIYSGAGGGDATTIQGVTVSAAAPALGDSLIYDGAQWAPGGNVLWRWNGADVTQFDAAIDMDVGANIAGLTRSVSGGALRFASTELDVGGVFFAINDFTIPTTNRFVIRARCLATFSDVTNAGRNLLGLCISNAAGTRILGIAAQNDSNQAAFTNLDPDEGGAGVPGLFTPGFAANAVGVLDARTGGATFEITWVFTSPVAGATPVVSVHFDGSGPVAGVTESVSVDMVSSGPYASSWAATALDTVGVTVVNTGVTTAWNIDFTMLQIEPHPLDMALRP